MDLSILEKIFAVVGFLALTGGTVWLYWKKGTITASSETLTTYKNLAESRLARCVDLEAERAKLVAKLQYTERALAECEQERDEISKQNLRFQSRLQICERQINTLRIALKMPVIDFEDPFGDPKSQTSNLS